MIPSRFSCVWLFTLTVLWTSGVVMAEINTTTDGCQLCVEFGNCSSAYLGRPGQFCGNWVDQANQPQQCCCPRDARCLVTYYACECTDPSSTSVISTSMIIIIVLIVLVALLGLGFCVWCCYKVAHPNPKAAKTFPGASTNQSTDQSVVYSKKKAIEFGDGSVEIGCGGMFDAFGGGDGDGFDGGGDGGD